MKRYFCDICGKEIKPADIHIYFNINMEDKVETLDLHTICFMQFKRAIKEITDDDARCD